MFSLKSANPTAHALHKRSSSYSFWDAFDLKFLVVSTNSLMVKIIQEKRLREALVLI